MDQAIQKQQSETLETSRRLYRQQWDQKFAEFMYLMAKQYRIELTVEHNGQMIPDKTLMDFWREGLKGAGPSQLKSALLSYMESANRSFPPQPGDIMAHIPPPSPKDDIVKEMRELKARAKAGEEFFGLADLVQEFKRLAEKKL